MRILWISDYSRGIRSGGTSQAILCGKGLANAGMEVVFCQSPALEIRGSKYVENEIEGCRLLYPIGNMMTTIEDVDPDIILIHCYSRNVLPEVPDIVRAYPTVVRVGMNVLELLVTRGHSNMIPNVITLLQSVDHAIAASENTRYVLEGLGCRSEDVSVIHTAVDPSMFKIHDCVDPTIGILGRVFPVKNHLTLIEAVKLIRKTFSRVELAITGDGILTDMYEILVGKLLLDTQIKHTGYMNDLNWFFKEISIFALPSFSENMPMSVVEAYACGIPCVLAQSGWADTFQAALKARADNPKEWADQLLKLLTDRDFYLRVREAQLKELEQFTITNITPLYVSLFASLLELKKYKIKKTNPKVD